MTAFAPFPEILPGDVATLADPAPCAETQLAAAVLRLGPGSAAARLHAAFGKGPGDTVLAARARLVAAMGGAEPAPDALAALVAATLHGPDAEERARPMALCVVPAHRMQSLVLAARDFGLALRRAALRRNGMVPSPCSAAQPSGPR